MKDVKQFEGKEQPVSKKRSKKFRTKQSHYPKTATQSTTDKMGIGKNDSAWYEKYAELMSIATTVPWHHIKGVPERLENGSVFYPDTVIRFNFYPTLGINDGPNSPLNYASRAEWLDLHRRFRGIGTYEQADLGIARVAIAEAWAQIARCELVYGLCRAYKSDSRLAPFSILAAMGISTANAQMIMADLANFRYNINRLLIKAKSLCLPKEYTLLKDRISYMGFVYADSEDGRAIPIVFCPEVYGVYESTALPTGGSIIYREYPASVSGVILLNIAETCLDALLNDTDIARICSDTLAAYGSENVEQITELPEEYVVFPTYDEHMLLKLHNADIIGNRGRNALRSLIPDADGNVQPALTTFVGSTPGTYPIVVSQEGNVIYTRLAIVGAQARATGSVAYRVIDPSTGLFILANDYYSATSNMIVLPNALVGVKIYDSWKEKPSNVEVLEASLAKFDYGFSHVTDTGNAINFDFLPIQYCSTIIISDMLIAKLGSGGQQNSAITYNVNSSYNTSKPMGNDSTIWQCVSRMDWAPLINDHNTTIINTPLTGVSNSYTLSGVLSTTACVGDLDNYFVTRGITNKILDAAVMSLFKVDLPIIK